MTTTGNPSPEGEPSPIPLADRVPVAAPDPSVTVAGRPALAARIIAETVKVRKFTTAVLCLAALAITTGEVHGHAAMWCQTIITAATALGVYAIPNDTDA